MYVFLSIIPSKKSIYPDELFKATTYVQTPKSPKKIDSTSRRELILINFN